MIKVLHDINEILEDELADHGELRNGEEDQMAIDSPLLEMDTTEDEIKEVRKETEAFLQQINDIESVPPPIETCLPCVANFRNISLMHYSPCFSSDPVLLENGVQFHSDVGTCMGSIKALTS